jgi:tetratricopeptide (TPR) repeat protein
MARPGKEQLFFLGTLAVTGLLGFFAVSDSWKSPGQPKGAAIDKKSLEPVDVPRAPVGALKNVDWVGAPRETFREPRDWNPLPPVDLERPPLREPGYVPPPPRPSAGLDHLGLYRTAAKITPHAFADEEGGDAAPPKDGDPKGDPGDDNKKSDPGDAKKPGTAPPASVPKGTAANAPANPKSTSGGGSGTSKSVAPSIDEGELRRRYDWLEVNISPKPMYGVIENKEKFTLPSRAGEAVQFRWIDPATNRLKAASAIPRDRIKEGGIHFAETPLNLAEQKLRAIPQSQWSATSLGKLLDAAAEVIELGQEDRAVWQRAAEELTKYVAIDPKSARTYELLADADAGLIDFEKELATLQAADAAGAVSPGLIERRARWLARIGARDGARARLRDGITRFPGDRGLRLALGRLLLQDGRGAEALEQFSQAESASTSGEERMQVTAQVGAALLERGECDKALQEARRILGIDHDAPLGIRLEGAAQVALGKIDEAVQAYARLAAAAKTPEWQGEALLAQGIVHTRTGAFDEARSELGQVTQLQPLLGAWSAVAEADLLATTDHLPDALARARDATSRAPDDPYLRYYLGRLLRRSEDFDGARTELRRALELGAAFSDLFNELGYLALLEGKAADARRYFEESLVREERPETRLLLGHAQLLGDDLLAARTTFEALNAKKPNGEALLGLAYVSYKRGESPQAQQMWQQVKEELASAHPDDRAYAAKWLAAVIDLESKQQWDDSIQWREVSNEWEASARFGLEVRTPGGSCRIEGTQRQGATVNQWTYLKREVDRSLAYEGEVEVALNPGNQGRTGFGLAAFIGVGAGQAPQVRSALMIAVEADGSLHVLHQTSLDDAEWKPVKDASGQPMKVSEAPGESIRLTLRRKERGSAQFQFLVDGVPVGDPLEMTAWKGKSRDMISALWIGSAPGGKRCDVELRHARRIQFLPQ